MRLLHSRRERFGLTAWRDATSFGHRRVGIAGHHRRTGAALVAVDSLDHLVALGRELEEGLAGTDRRRLAGAAASRCPRRASLVTNCPEPLPVAELLLATG